MFKAAMVGDYNKAIEISRSLNSHCTVRSMWITGYDTAGGRVPVAWQKKLDETARDETRKNEGSVY
jgi:hypothetical protein